VHLKTLHVALVSPFFPLKGGIARFSTTLRNVLLKRGQTVDAISFKRLYPGILLRGKAVYEPGASSQPEDGVLPLLDALNPLTWLRAARFIRRIHPAVMVCAYWLGPLAPMYWLLQRVSGIKMIVLMHNYTSHERFFAEKKFRDLLLKDAAGVVTLSGYVARQVKVSYPELPVKSLFHPVYRPENALISRQDACRDLGIGPDEHVLLFFGYVREYKGLDLLIEAMPEVLRRHPGTHLVIAGEFYYGEKMIRERIELLGIGGRVRVYSGFVPAERVPLFFSAADVAVLPYREASQSGVVQQAYGFGCPVIVSGVGGLPEVVDEGKTGVVVRDLDSHSLADGICSFLENRKAVPYRENVVRYADHLSWEVFTEKIEDFMLEVVA